MLLRPLIWLSTNSSRVCAFAFGKSFSAFSSAAVFASVYAAAASARTCRGSAATRTRGRRSALENVTCPNGEPPAGGSKMPLTSSCEPLPRRDLDR